MQVVDFNSLKPIIAKSADFFASKKLFKNFKDDIPEDQIEHIADVELECLAYGHFEPEELLMRFETYIIDLIKYCKNIKVLKIQFNGFDLFENKILQNIAKAIETLK